MAKRVTAGSIVQSSLIMAFTIVVALIWRDVISHTIAQLVPAKQELYYEFLVAVLATIIIVIIIFAIVKTESEAEILMKRMKEKNGLRFRKPR